MNINVAPNWKMNYSLVNEPYIITVIVVLQCEYCLLSETGNDNAKQMTYSLRLMISEILYQLNLRENVN